MQNYLLLEIIKLFIIILSREVILKFYFLKSNLEILVKNVGSEALFTKILVG